MPRYAALLRGIGPGNPKLSNANLCSALKAAGCSDIQAVLASGNLVFTATARTPAALVSKIEAALLKKTGVAIEAFILSHDTVDSLIKSDPFQGAEHGKEWYLTVTFRQAGQPPIFNKLDRAAMDGPQFMADLERKHGKHITTRTWNTLKKIAEKLPRGSGNSQK